MVKISLIIIFGVLEVRSRTMHTNGQKDISQDLKSTFRQLENSYKENKFIHSPLRLLEHILAKNLKIKSQPGIHKISPNMIKNEGESDQIISHNVSKRSPGCLLWCLKKRILHPAQCHSYCRFSG